MSRDLLKEKGWRRHSVISQKNGDLGKLQEYLPEKIHALLSIEGAVAIISTYDCAVIDENFEREPWVQFLIAFPAEFQKSLAECRAPRRIHFYICIEGKQQSYEVNAVGVCQTAREILKEIEPDMTFLLPKKSKDNLNYWIAERFRQETWPDALIDAIKPINSRLKRFWKRYNDYSSALYMQLHTYEELKTGKYEVSIIFAIEEGKERLLFKQMRENNKQFINKSIEELRVSLESEIADIFGDAIVIMDDNSKDNNKAIEILGEDSITVFHLKTHFRFSPFNLSAQGNQAPVPVDTIPNKTF